MYKYKAMVAINQYPKKPISRTKIFRTKEEAVMWIVEKKTNWLKLGPYELSDFEIIKNLNKKESDKESVHMILNDVYLFAIVEVGSKNMWLYENFFFQSPKNEY